MNSPRSVIFMYRGNLCLAALPKQGGYPGDLPICAATANKPDMKKGAASAAPFSRLQAEA
jgi:hypothetical protein